VASFEGAESVVRAAPSFPSRFSNSDAAIRWLDEHLSSFDLMIVNEIWSVMLQRALALARRRRVPYIVQPRGSLDPYDLQKKSALKALLGPWVVGPNLAGASCILAASVAEKERLRTFGAPVAVEVLPHPISPLPAGDRARLRGRLGLDESHVAFLFMARMDSKKRVDLLLEAFFKMRESVPSVRLLIAGDDQSEHGRAMKALAMRYPHAGDVKFLGFVGGTDKQDVLAAGDVFVLPSDFENFGVAVIEAMHAGLPVILSKGVQIWKEVADAGAGAVFDGSAGDLALQMSSLALCSERRKSASAHAADLARNYTPGHLQSAYSSFWESRRNPSVGMEKNRREESMR
jgi:glycosyltransferase involved in cell wall biosynthesis